MGKRIKAWNVFSRILFLVVFAASIGVFWLTRTGTGYTDFFINLVFAALAGIFLILYFEGSARPLARIASALARKTEDIRDADATPRELWNRYSQNDHLFDERRLDERWRAYLKESRRLQKQSSLTADVRLEDYIGEELLYSAVNKPFCDQLGGIMSGLGILFTFIGLVYGLRNFDASTVDVMQTSTQALMAGIKIAFLTSIFGLIYSLLFGLTYKKLLRDSLETLYDFQDAFTEDVRPTNEHAAENAMLRLQTEQNAALQSFGTSIGTQVSEAIITLMTPSVDELKRTITQYVTVAIEDQRAGMERVVKYFLESMNTALGNIFVQLKARTEELTRWEKDMIDSIGLLSADVARTTAGLGDAQKNAAAITETMASYTDAIEKLTAAQRGVTEEMRGLLGDYRTLREQEQEYLRVVSDSAQSTAETSREALKASQAAAAVAAGIDTSSAAAARELSDAGALIARSAEDIRSLSESAAADVTTAADRLTTAARDLDGVLSRSVSDSMALLDESIARLNDSMGGMNAAADNVTRSLQSLPRTASAIDGDVKAVSKAIDAELKVLLKAVSDTQKSLNKFNAELDRRTDVG